MSSTDLRAYPWDSQAIYAAELDPDGTVLRANRALTEAFPGDLDGASFAELLTVEQRASFHARLSEVDADWRGATFGFFDGGTGSAEDRHLWLRRTPTGSIELIAEPAWHEHDRLVEQVLQLNDDLIATQRRLARRQRDLEHAQEQAARSAERVARLEAILLAGLTPRDFDEALESLLMTSQHLLPGDRAEILLLDETGDRLVRRAMAGPGAPVQLADEVIPVGTGVLGHIAATGLSVMVENLGSAHTAGLGDGPGSLIGAPLRVEERVIGVMCVSAAGRSCFSEEDLKLLELVGERVALAIGQAQLRDREQRMAETLARTLLPQRLPAPAGFRVVARYRATTASVGGDFYDALALPDGRLGVAIGDVTGKGLRAAAAMGRMRSALHAYALDAPSPSEVLRRLDRLAVADEAMATALYMVLDPSSGVVELASAGHLPPLHLESGASDYVDLGDALSPPLGLTVERRPQMEFVLSPGAALVLYTDGLVERTRDVDRGMEALRQAVGERAGHRLEDLCDELLRALAPEGRYRDDVAILAVRRHPFPAPEPRR